MSFRYFIRRQSAMILDRYWNYQNHLYRSFSNINKDRLILRISIRTVECIMFESTYNQNHLVDGYVDYKCTQRVNQDKHYILVVRRGGYVFCIEYKNIDLNKAFKVKEYMLDKIDEVHKKILDETVY